MKWGKLVCLLVISAVIHGQGMDSVWVSNELSPPYSPTLTTQVYTGDTLNFRIGFSTQDTIERFFIGLSYDSTKFQLLNMDFDVVNAVDGSPFQWWVLWSPTSVTVPCATTILDSICMATWMGMELAGSMFALPPGNWMVGTFTLRAKQSGYTILLPSYLDTAAGFKIPYPCVVNIQVGVAEKYLQETPEGVSVEYLKNHILHIVLNRTGITHLSLKLYSPGGRIAASREFSDIGDNFYVDLNSILNKSGIYFAVVETQQERHILRLVYIKR